MGLWLFFLDRIISPVERIGQAHHTAVLSGAADGAVFDAERESERPRMTAGPFFRGSAPKVVFFGCVFFGILLHSLQISRDLPQVFLFIRGQVRLEIVSVDPTFP
jgi:hypothetical protein